MSENQNEWVILGVTETGEIFDVPYWPERLCGLLADQAQDNRVSYSDYLTPSNISGYQAVIVLNALAKDDPVAFAIVAKFVAGNQLKTRLGRVGNSTGEHNAIKEERRQYIRG